MLFVCLRGGGGGGVGGGVRQTDSAGLFTSCVRVSLETGEVVEQNIVPATTHCHPVFVREWARLLGLRYNTRVSVRHGSSV